ncbi:MAG: BNR repeat-containing protein [Planctomycetota bacterium]|jgi:hypothetical protein
MKSMAATTHRTLRFLAICWLMFLAVACVNACGSKSESDSIVGLQPTSTGTGTTGGSGMGTQTNTGTGTYQGDPYGRPRPPYVYTLKNDETTAVMDIIPNPAAPPDMEYCVRFGQNYIQADGSFGAQATARWDADAAWGISNVTGLTAGIKYWVYSMGRNPDNLSETTEWGTKFMEVVEEFEISDVWSGNPAQYALVTSGNYQFVAFYNADKYMSVAARTLDESTWEITALGSQVGWDSHNYIAMAVDDNGCVHVSCNMHGDPLVYYRTSQPFDISTFQKISSMVGNLESSVTYPQFMRDSSDRLIYTYRDGGSGDGDQIYNVYNHSTKLWSRLLSPLIQGNGLSTYMRGPIFDNNGKAHILFMWRETGDASTNKNLSYSCSYDMANWIKSNGSAQAVPITPQICDTFDPVPPGGGLINTTYQLGFDSIDRPIAVYHKYDESGYSQVYAARLEGTSWNIKKMTDFSSRWDFGGYGSLSIAVSVFAPVPRPNNTVSFTYIYNGVGSGTLVIDESTFSVLGCMLSGSSGVPLSLIGVESDFEGMKVRWCSDSGDSDDQECIYKLRWETVDSDSDQPQLLVPPPTKLRLYILR